VPGSTVPVDRVATRPWVTPCQITGAALIKSKRSQPVALDPCLYLMATAVKPARPRTLAQLIAHPWVEEVSDERGMGQGIWVYLKSGYQWDGCQTIHEDTVGDCLAQFATVEERPAPAARPVLPGEATPPPAQSHGKAAPRLPEVSTPRPLHPLAEMLLMRLAATDAPCLAVERLPIWDALAESGWIQIIRVVRTREGGWCECCITGLGRAVLDARPPV
jgi:hypothetical protein